MFVDEATTSLRVFFVTTICIYRIIVASQYVQRQIALQLFPPGIAVN
jgi:hypothetical protein